MYFFAHPKHSNSWEEEEKWNIMECSRKSLRTIVNIPDPKYESSKASDKAILQEVISIASSQRKGKHESHSCLSCLAFITVCFREKQKAPLSLTNVYSAIPACVQCKGHSFAQDKWLAFHAFPNTGLTVRVKVYEDKGNVFKGKVKDKPSCELTPLLSMMQGKWFSLAGLHS